MYKNDQRIVITLDAGGTNFVFSAMRGYDYIIDQKPVAISFAFPGPADYRAGIIGGYLPNFPSFRDGVALGPFLKAKFDLPVFINNDGDLFALGEATGGALKEINDRIKDLGGNRRYTNLLG